MERLILVGMPGAGKSAVGRLVAARLGWPFVDLDEAIEAREGRTIPALFAEGGEAAFRAAEAAALLAVLAEAPLVLACGGGAPFHGDNADRLRAAGHVVWLRASLSSLLDRTAGGGRPLLTGDRRARLAHLIAQREGGYRRTAHRAVETDGRSLDAIAAELTAGIVAAGAAGQGGPSAAGPEETAGDAGDDPGRAG